MLRDRALLGWLVGSEVSMQKVVPFLWFNSADEAVEFYLSVFKSGRRLDAVLATEGGIWEQGQTVTHTFEIEGQTLIAFSGGPVNFEHNASFSLVVHCEDQAEIDYYWNALTLMAAASSSAAG